MAHKGRYSEVLFLNVPLLPPMPANSSQPPAADHSIASSEPQLVLVLQGGGALGAYQVGVYEALHEAGIEPHWIIGTSIGAINAALIAGNPREDRMARLDAFWEQATQDAPLPGALLPSGAHHWLAMASTFAGGVPGFFQPNPDAWRGPLVPVGVEHASWYVTEPLRQTLRELTHDGESLGSCGIRLTVGAVAVGRGTMHYFDSRRQPLTVDHIMASGALPPGFPAVTVDGAAYWDGGIHSNTPIEAVLEDSPRRSSLIFSVDVWHRNGPEPQSIWEVLERQKDIQYASQADSHIARQKQIHHLRHVIRELVAQLPPERRSDPHVRSLGSWGCHTTMHIVRMLAPRMPGEDLTKDIDFTPAGVRARREAGLADTRRMLERAPWNEPCDPLAGIIEHHVRDSPVAG